METALPIIEIAEKSQQRETLLLVIFGMVATVWVIKQIVPLIQWAKGDKKLVDSDEANQREAVRILLQKDVDGQYVLLGLPRMLREFSHGLEGFTGQLRQLVNHQSETLKHLDKTANETLRVVNQVRTEQRREGSAK